MANGKFVSISESPQCARASAALALKLSTIKRLSTDAYLDASFSSLPISCPTIQSTPGWPACETLSQSVMLGSQRKSPQWRRGSKVFRSLTPVSNIRRIEALPKEVSVFEEKWRVRFVSDMSRQWRSQRNGLICACIVAACVLLTYPVAEMGFQDDWSYIRTALEFARTGHFVYNGWATAMLGWIIPWSALFIKVFGFSFTLVRLSMLPVTMACVYLFHANLVRFGIRERNAVLGALTLGLSPIFLPMAASYMTDVAGLFVIVLCLYLCQRAVVAQSDRAVVLWLCCAAASNVVGGTVRQISWLGALVMVPSTAWLLRSRRGVAGHGDFTLDYEYLRRACMPALVESPAIFRPGTHSAGSGNGTSWCTILAALSSSLSCVCCCCYTRF